MILLEQGQKRPYIRSKKGKKREIEKREREKEREKERQRQRKKNMIRSERYAVRGEKRVR